MRPPLLILAVLMVGALPARGAPAPAKKHADGSALYMRYCSSCHGVGADGHGPVAPALARPPKDLRRLTDRYGTPLSADRLAAWIDGREDVDAHGTREMPVWGERFRAPPGALDPRIRAIVTYLDSLQAR